MLHLYPVLVCAFAMTSAPVPKTPADEWLGETVFPRSQRLPLQDEMGKIIGTWSVTAGKVIRADSEKVQLRHNQSPGPHVGYVMKSEVVRLAEAVAFFTEKIQENERNVWAWQNRATAWALKNQPAKAIEDLSEIIRLDPRSYAYVYRGNAWAAQKEYDRAIEDLTEAVRLDPSSANAFANRGNVWIAKKEYDKAISDLDEAIRLDPSSARAFMNRGNAWKNKKEYDKAIADLDEAIRLDPTYPTSFNIRGMTWAKKKEFDKAYKDYDEAIRLDPKFAIAFYNKACSCALDGKAEPAVENLRRSFELGYRNFDHVSKDPDLDSIRSDTGYVELMKKYMP